MTLKAALLATAALAMVGAARAPEWPALSPAQLRCEYATNPLGIDMPAPRLSWRVESPERGQRQTAWQIVVSTSQDRLAADRGDLWDSGRVASSETLHVPYAGSALSSSQQVFWKVRVWDRDGRRSAWSPPATWTMGILRADEWKGSWIAAPAATETLLLRRTFAVRPGLTRAVAHVSGLGHFELTLDGRRVGTDLFAPGWTDYDRTTLYDTHDLTATLAEGRHAVGLFLGNGMYHVVRRNRFAKFTGSFGPLRALLHLRLEYADGSVEFVGTGPDWRTYPGPVTYSSIYGGEDHDARLEPRGWDTAEFDDRAWSPAVPVIRLGDTLRGHSAAADPIREIAVLPVKGERRFDNGTVVYDFGQNMSFVPRLRVDGPAGSTIRLTPAEVTSADGTIYRGTMGSPARGSSWWQYTKATDGVETWTPRFYYVGSRYLQAEFYGPGAVPTTADDDDTRRGRGVVDPGRLPGVVSIEAVVVHSSASPAGHFVSSNPLLNRIRDLVRWAQRSNMVSVLTDCPHREKLGWIEQFHLNGPSIRYEFDVSRIFTKAMHDMADAQTADGLVPNIAPEYTEFDGAFRNAAEWGAAFILVPWQQYVFNGDVGLLRTHYDAMTRYLAFLDSRTQDGLLSDGLGDWYDFDLATPGRAGLTPAPITATAFYYLDTSTLAQMARVLGKDGDARRYEARAAAIRARYNAAFYRAAAQTYGTGSQASLAIPLAMGLVDPEAESPVLEALIRDIEARGYATAGDIGFRSVLQALAQRGRSDVIGRLVNQDEKPGYAYQIKKGATTLAEAWDANLGVSQNHFILGQIIEWFYQDLVGITPDPAGPGFAHVIVRPQPVAGVTWAEATYASVRGPITVRWDHTGDRFTLRVTVPANATATVRLPARDAGTVREGGANAGARPGVTFVSHEGDRAIFTIESGTYTFESRW